MYKGNLSFQYNIDTDGDPVSIQITDEIKQISPIHYCVQLNQIPDEFQRVVVRYNGDILYEVFDVEELQPTSFKVNYSSGLVFFHQSMASKNVSLSYYGRGVELIHASRILLSDGTTLEDKILDIENRLDSLK